MSETGLELVLRAARFAAHHHRNQRRKGEEGEPYLNHLIEVAHLLTEATNGGDPPLVAAAMLHDVVEDQEVSHADLVAEFGDEVASLVAEVTDDKSLEKAVRKRLQVEETPHKSVRARMLKLADKTSNLRAIVASPPAGWSRRRKVEYFEWAEQVAAGCRGTNDRLEGWFDEAHRQGMRALAMDAEAETASG